MNEGENRRELNKINVESDYFGHVVWRVSGRKKMKSEEVAIGEKGFKDFGGEKRTQIFFSR